MLARLWVADVLRLLGCRSRLPRRPGKAAVVEGRSNKEIAAALSISTHTVERHLSNVYAKLGVARRSQLAGRIMAGHGR